MRILLTNDDGLQSPGIKALRQTLSDDHELWIVAPKQERSGASHSITITEAVRTKSVDERTFACSGTPVDCVLVALYNLLPEPPDVVISGINIGPNLGGDLTFSGTAAAAREAALLEIPAIAVSLDAFNPPFHFDSVTDFIVANLSTLVSLWRPDCFLNINFPNREEGPAGVMSARLCRNRYENRLMQYAAPTGDSYHFYDGKRQTEISEHNTDLEALSSGCISVSAVYIFPVLSPTVGEIQTEQLTLPRR